MKLKKALAAVLSAAMIITSLPAAAFAEDVSLSATIEKVDGADETHSHTFGAWNYDKENEVFVKECEDCGETQQEEMPADVKAILDEIDADTAEDTMDAAVDDGILTAAAAAYILSTVKQAEPMTVDADETLALQYDDYYTFDDAATVTSDNGDIIAVDGTTIHAVGVSDTPVTVTVDETAYSVTVSKAKLNIVVVMGQSNSGLWYGDSQVPVEKGTTYYWGQRNVNTTAPVDYTDASSGRGFHKALLAELYAQSVEYNNPEKNVLVWAEGYTSYNGNALSSWVSSVDNTSGTDNTVKMVNACRNYYQAQSDKYELGDTVVYWLQGESDQSNDGKSYYDRFAAMWNRLKTDAGADYLAFLRVRKNNVGTNAQNIDYTGAVSAQYQLANDFNDIFMATTLTEGWVGAKDKEFTIDVSDYNTLKKLYNSNSITATMNELYGYTHSCHYETKGYEVIGADAAFNMYNALHGTNAMDVVNTDATGEVAGQSVTAAGGAKEIDLSSVKNNLAFHIAPGSKAGTLALKITSQGVDVTNQDGMVTASGSLFATVNTAKLKTLKDVKIEVTYMLVDGSAKTTTYTLTGTGTDIDTGSAAYYYWDFTDADSYKIGNDSGIADDALKTTGAVTVEAQNGSAAGKLVYSNDSNESIAYNNETGIRKTQKDTNYFKILNSSGTDGIDCTVSDGFAIEYEAVIDTVGDNSVILGKNDTATNDLYPFCFFESSSARFSCTPKGGTKFVIFPFANSGIEPTKPAVYRFEYSGTTTNEFKITMEQDGKTVTKTDTVDWSTSPDNDVTWYEFLSKLGSRTGGVSVKYLKIWTAVNQKYKLEIPETITGVTIDGITDGMDVYTDDEITFSVTAKNGYTLTGVSATNCNITDNGDGTYTLKNILGNPVISVTTTCNIEFDTKWSYDDTYHWHYGITPGFENEKSTVAAHTYGDAIVVKPATKKEEGLQKRVCNACGYEETTAIPRLNSAYRWDFDDDTLNAYDEDNNVANKILDEALLGTYEVKDGALKGTGNYQGELEKPIVLEHDKDWTLEWKYKTAGDSEFLLSTLSENVVGNIAIYRLGTEYTTIAVYRPADASIATGSGYYNYGAAYCPKDGDVLKLANTYDKDSDTNTITMYVNGQVILNKLETNGWFNGYTPFTEAQKEKYSLSGQDFEFKYVGGPTAGFALKSAIDYIAYTPDSDHVHTFDGTIGSDEYGHWEACEDYHVCGGIRNFEKHTMVDGVCSVCGYSAPKAKLTDFVANGMTLANKFNENTTSYVATVFDTTTSITVKPTADGTITVKYGDDVLTAESDGTYVFTPSVGKTLYVTVGSGDNATTYNFDIKIESDLDSLKATAKAELDSYVDADDYTQNAGALAEAIANGKSDIDNAITAGGVEKALAAAKAAIDAIAKDATLTLSESEGTYRVNKGPVTVTYTYNGDGKVTAVSSDNTVATATVTGNTVTIALKSTGSATITVAAEATANYVAAEASYDLTVLKKKSSSSSDTSAPTYGVSTGKTENGTISVTPAKAEAGEKVTIKATPDSGYQLDKVTVKDKNNSNVKLTKVNDNEYTFTMPSGKASVDATFVQKDAADDNQNNAGEKSKVIKLQIGSRIVTVDNEAVIYDVAPVIRNDRTLVPIRIVTETLGGKVDWNGATKEVTLNIDGKEIKMTVGKTLEKYGVAPVIIDGRTFVPVRFVADELGATVAWDDATKTVTVTKIEK